MLRRNLVGIIALALGASLSGLIGSGLLAVVVDSVTSTGNSIRSGEIAAPARLKAGILADGQDCAIENVSDVTTIAALIESESIALTPGAHVTSKRVCLYNAGGEAATLKLGIGNLVDLEDNTTPGTCDSTEANPDGGNDLTCGPEDPGELSELLQLREERPPCNCDTGGPPGGVPLPPPTFDWWLANGPFPVDLQPLGPGHFRELTLVVHVIPGATSTQLQAAQTDRLQWDFIFTLDA